MPPFSGLRRVAGCVWCCEHCRSKAIGYGGQAFTSRLHTCRQPPTPSHDDLTTHSRPPQTHRMSSPDEEHDEDVTDCPPLPASASQCCRLRNGKRGRHVKAAQALPTPGTTVLQDQPYAVVVSDIYRNVCCAACLHVCTTQIFACGGCSVTTFYCSSACVARDGALVHTGAECQALKKLAAMGVEGDSQAMRLALRLVRFWVDGICTGRVDVCRGRGGVRMGRLKMRDTLTAKSA